ncbi:hypothetical protein U2F10_34915 [Leptothoe sp. EHU-05/26/07-4]|uniref:Uncharacterized protein n=1 Tax=Adonisia turfae CCMR0081 TaxID=2292702 RepID=A0A6M0RQR3_9CYAN|nr:hypothetical protein [Adonisia turfae]NEZ58479.1 hypothetical protein [Adonisia turfae CCMR0081]
MNNHTEPPTNSPNPSQPVPPLPGRSDVTPSEMIELEVTSPDPIVTAATSSEQFEELDPLLPLADLIPTLADYEKQRVDPDTGQVLTVEEIKLDMPVELRVIVDEAGQVTLKGAPPTQRTATTVLPMFHQMQMHIVEARYGD